MRSTFGAMENPGVAVGRALVVEVEVANVDDTGTAE